jgi:hypothetical protein
VTARLLPVLLLASARVAAQEPAGASQQASYAASASLYFLEDDEDYLQPTVALDRDRLHLEARYNYEDRDTASAWIGINLAAGDALSLEFTPMLGVVAGRTKGIAPGFKVTLGWRSLGPAKHWRIGIAAQRTRVYETDFDIQRGLLLGASFGRLDVTAYVLNPDESPTVVLAAAAGF